MAETPQKSDVAKREETILAFWNENKIFEKSVAQDAPNGEYAFYDGPPFATGLPHYGHIVTGLIKDVIPRYKTMRGYSVPRVWGWDCHGLPIENIVEKQLGFKHKKDIKNFGIAKFNEACRAQVMTYAHEWEKIIPRTGRWVDMEHAYRTMDKPYMESVWWVFKTIYDKGLVYEDYRSMHICTRCETTLSQQEVSEGYKDIKDIAVTVQFKVKNPGKHGLPENTYLLAWTTTPWTLPGNVALAVGKNIQYVLVKDFKSEDNERPKNIVLAFNRVPNVIRGTGSGMTYISGEKLVGIEYEPLFDYYAKDQNLKNRENGWKVYAADFVTAEDGTGIAQEAPAFGADDWELLKENNLPFVQHVNFDGTMKPEVTDFAGMEVKPNAEDKVRLATDIAVLKYLQDHGLFFAKENITHSYPHCWRCDTPLLNYATSSWFVSVTKLKDELMRTAQNVHWSPSHIKEGLFGKWLEGARDWSISRQRFWASVIPMWVCDSCKKQRVFGSVAELEEASGVKIDDLHKHIIDEVTVPCECGNTMHRVPDVLDTWFDSGSMPYGQVHYPFENKERFEKTFPAQFITEYTGQFRAWFYYLHVLAGATFDTNAFQNVVAHGIVLAEDGKKMSKRLQNYPDPMDVISRYGADALRLYMLSSPLLKAENLNFSESGVDETLKKNIGRLNNVLEFYKLYADGTPRSFASTHILDQWILARIAALIGETTDGLESYALDDAVRALPLFIDDLSVWYLRRSRDRFKEEGPDQTAALATLRYVLHTLSRVTAPSMPFYAEYLFQAVRESEDEESVHLSRWPEIPALAADATDILTRMFAVRAVVSQALKERETAGINVRQPLPRLTLGMQDALSENVSRIAEYVELIKDEVNVKEVAFTPTPGLSLDTSITPELKEEGFVRKTVREIQAYRKAQNLKPGEPATYRASFSAEDRAILEKHAAQILKTTNTEIQFD
ncbi:MAG: isoleucine--tRNA ligase [Candidatus Kaiserbacteria bacterium]|nr:isoleucine--tRNA ligase [Candidatus Kaiserbacteria bacterium]